MELCKKVELSTETTNECDSKRDFGVQFASRGIIPGSVGDSSTIGYTLYLKIGEENDLTVNLNFFVVYLN